MRADADQAHALDLWYLPISGSVLRDLASTRWVAVGERGTVITCSRLAMDMDTSEVLPVVTAHYPQRGRVMRLRHRLAVWLLRPYFARSTWTVDDGR